MKRLWLWLSTLFLLPAFFYSGPGLVDDAEILWRWQEIVRRGLPAVAELLSESANGRFRPLYHAWFLLLPIIAGSRMWFWTLFNLVWLWLMLWLVYRFVRRTLSPRWSVILAASILLLPSAAGNFYRFGTPEPRQLVFLLLSLWFFGRGKITGGLIAWLSALWTKETSLFFTPGVLLWAWPALPKGRTRWLTSTAIIALSVFTAWLIPPGSGHAGNFVLTFSQAAHLWFDHARVAWPETYYGFWIILAGLVMLGVRAKRQPTIRAEVRLATRWFALTLCAWLPLLFWTIPLERYSLLLHAFLLLTLSAIAPLWIDQFWRRRQAVGWYAVLAGLLLLLVPPWQLIKMGPGALYRTGTEVANWSRNYRQNGELSRRLRSDPTKAWYVDSVDLEYNFAIGLYASRLQPADARTRIITRFSFPQPIFLQDDNPAEAFGRYCFHDCALLRQSNAGWQITGPEEK
jgi:hypothetical protein